MTTPINVTQPTNTRTLSGESGVTAASGAPLSDGSWLLCWQTGSTVRLGNLAASNELERDPSGLMTDKRTVLTVTPGFDGGDGVSVTRTESGRLLLLLFLFNITITGVTGSAYASAPGSVRGGFIYESFDDGDTWTLLTTSPASPGVALSYGFGFGEPIRPGQIFEYGSSLYFRANFGVTYISVGSASHGLYQYTSSGVSGSKVFNSGGIYAGGIQTHMFVEGGLLWLSVGDANATSAPLGTDSYTWNGSSASLINTDTFNGDIIYDPNNGGKLGVKFREIRLFDDDTLTTTTALGSKPLSSGGEQDNSLNGGRWVSAGNWTFRFTESDEVQCWNRPIDRWVVNAGAI